MKIRTLLLTIAGFLLAGALFYSCEKDMILDDSPEPDMSALKAAPSNVTLNPMELLGKEIFFDKISSPAKMACATCHAPEVGFTGPNPGVNLQTAIYPGAIHRRFGNRKPPSAAYATLSPPFYFDTGEGLYIGGNFWDGRATGYLTGNPAGDQALGPFLNPVEQNMPNMQAVLQVIAESDYAGLWEDVWGSPIDLGGNIEAQYMRIGLSIAAYEDSPEVNQFSSKFDAFLAGEAELTGQEMWGLELFNGKGQCNLCHPSEGPAPLFTDFSYDNLGTPKNPDNPWYEMPSNFNPDGAAWVDPGLGGFLQSVGLPGAAENWGKHKVPTLRNVAKAPSPQFTKAYMHNGVFKSLKDVVHFYNTRDVEVWPAPEVTDNVNFDELGNLGLTGPEEDAIVAFMETLSDGWAQAGRSGRNRK